MVANRNISSVSLLQYCGSNLIFCQVISHCRHQQPTSLVTAFISHTLFLALSCFVILHLLIQRPSACHRILRGFLCTVAVQGEKEGIEMVSRPLVATYLLQSDLQLWRAGLNGNSFSHFFSTGIGKYCLSRQCMNPRTAISSA